MLAAAVEVGRIDDLAALVLVFVIARIVELRLVGRGEVVQTFAVGRLRGREVVEQQILGAVGIDGVAGDAAQQVEALGELAEAAGLEALARVHVGGPHVLIGAEDAARLLAPDGGVLRDTSIRSAPGATAAWRACSRRPGKRSAG